MGASLATAIRGGNGHDSSETQLRSSQMQRKLRLELHV